METRQSSGATIRRIAAAVRRRALDPTLVLNVGAPAGAYQLLTRHGVSSLDALLAAALFPLAGIAITAARRRRLDVIGGLSVAAIAIGLVGGLVFRDARFVLLKDSIVTGTLGLAFLASALVRRPLAGLALRSLGPRAMEQAGPLTAVWGAGMVAEATARVALSFVVSPGVLLVVSPLLAASVFGPLGIWTVQRLASLRSRPALVA